MLRTTLTRFRELRLLADEAADVEWRHPSYWSLFAGSAVFDREIADEHGCDRHALTSDGSPYSDTFMARSRSGSGGAAARAVARARAALDALDHLDGTFADQPLRVFLVADAGGLRRGPAATDRRVAFVTERGIAVTSLARGRQDDPALIHALEHSSNAGPVRWIEASDDAPILASVAVSLGNEGKETARHVHRRAHTRGGGPWLGISDAGDWEVVSTCHMIVDGYGHASLADRIFRATSTPALPSSADQKVVLAPVAGAVPLGIATRIVRGPAPRFSALAYAFASSLQNVYGPRGRYSPTFQVPVAPGQRGDPRRRLSRVVPELVSLRRDESPTGFADRMSHVIERAAERRGLMSRLMNATLRAPVPLAWKRHWIHQGSRARPWFPASEMLAGRGCLSLLRLQPDQRLSAPLYAVSAPPLCPSRGDSMGSVVMTCVVFDEGCAVTVTSNASRGATAHAQRILDECLREHGAMAPDLHGTFARESSRETTR